MDAVDIVIDTIKHLCCAAIGGFGVAFGLNISVVPFSSWIAETLYTYDDGVKVSSKLGEVANGIGIIVTLAYLAYMLVTITGAITGTHYNPAPDGYLWQLGIGRKSLW